MKIQRGKSPVPACFDSHIPTHVRMHTYKSKDEKAMMEKLLMDVLEVKIKDEENRSWGKKKGKESKKKKRKFSREGREMYPESNYMRLGWMIYLKIETFLIWIFWFFFCAAFWAILKITFNCLAFVLVDNC